MISNKDKMIGQMLELLERDSCDTLFDEKDRVKPGYSRFQKNMDVSDDNKLHIAYARRDDEWGRPEHDPFTEWYFRFEDCTPDLKGRPKLRQYNTWAYPKKYCKRKYPGSEEFDTDSYRFHIPRIPKSN